MSQIKDMQKSLSELGLDPNVTKSVATPGVDEPLPNEEPTPLEPHHASIYFNVATVSASAVAKSRQVHP